MHSRKVRMVLAVILALGLVTSAMAVGGCAPSNEGGGGEQPAGEQPVAGGTLSYKISEPAFIDSYNLQESEGTQVGQAIFDSLTNIDSQGNVVAAAAESWEPNEDATVWTFKLNPNGKFHNGKAVTAEDFVYGWNRIITSPVNIPKAPSEISYHLAVVNGYDQAQKDGKPVAGLKAVDDLTLEVTLAYAFADFPYVVAHPGLAPVDKAEVDKDPTAYADKPVGNGPFMMAEPWKHDQYIKLTKFADYYGTKPYLDGVEFKLFKDDETAYRDFQAGNLDFTHIPDGQIEAAKTTYGESEDGYTVNPGKQVLLGAEAAIYYFTINNTDPTLKNQKLREALSWAINRQALSETVYEGTRIPANNFVPPSIPGYEDNVWANSNYDVEKAKTLLSEAGFPEGKGLPTFTINYNTGAGHEKVVEVIQSDWKKIGVNTKTEGLEFPQHIDKMQSGKYQIGRAGWIADYPIMDNFLYPEFTSGSPDNWSKYANKDVDSQLETARKTTDDAARIAAYQSVNKTVADGFPVIPIVYYAHRDVGSDRVHDLFYSNQGLTDFQKVWLTNGGAAQ